MRTRISLGLAAAALACGALANEARAGGFELRAWDAKATGMSQAFTAIADNASAANYNPAGMSQLDGIQASISATVIKPRIHFKPDNPGEGEANSISKASIAPSIAATFQVTDIIHLGLGINAPFGTNVRWEEEWPGRYIATHTQITSLQVMPSVAIRMPFMPEGTSLAVGGGLGIMTTNVLLRQRIDASAAGQPDARVKLYGDTNSHLRTVWHVSGLATLMDRMISLGVSFHSATQNNVIHGRAEFDDVPTNPVTGDPVLPSVSRARTKINFPDTLKTGVAVRPIEDLTIGAEFTWTNWSRLSKVTIELQDVGDGTGGTRTSTIPLDWTDTYFYSLGVEYAVIHETLFLRGGVFYDESPTRVHTVSSSIPDNHRKGFSLGIGFNPIENLQLDFAYAAVFLNDLHKNNDVGKDSVLGGNPRANGDYETFAHTATFTIGVWF